MTQTVTLASDDLTATISSFGARLQKLHYQGGPNLVLHSDDPAWIDSYAGALVGPIANRVHRGQVTIAGKRHQMPCNEAGINGLHSGPDGLDRQVWEVVEQDAQSVHLRCALSDSAGGLPGDRSFDVTYSLAGATLRLEISATTDTATPISIAHHPYWCLGSARDHRIRINADTYLPVNTQNIPTGNIVPVAATSFDHRQARALDPATDHNFCLANAPRPAPAPAATLYGTEGLTLDIETTEPGLQVYAGAYLPTLPETEIAPFAGIALEPQGWPDAVNQTQFPSIIATADNPYLQITLYHLGRGT